MIRVGHIALPIAAAALSWVVPNASLALGAGVRPPEAAASADVAPVVRRALERALTAPGARIDSAIEEHGSARPSDCHAAEVEIARSIESSGRLAVKISGRSPHGTHCEVWIWVRLRVVAPVAVATRALRAGDPLEGAFATEEHELRAGHPPAVIGPASVASRALAAGQMLDAASVGDPMVRSGDVVKVLVVSGALVIEQSGRGVPCVRGRSCAVLASGKQVEGDLIDGRLVVQARD